MGTNGPKLDQLAHLRAKTTKKLQAELKRALDGQANNTCEGANDFFANYVGMLKLVIAERIGK